MSRFRIEGGKARFGLKVRGVAQFTFKHYARLFINTCVGVGTDANAHLDAVSLPVQFSTLSLSRFQGLSLRMRLLRNIGEKFQAESSQLHYAADI